MIKAIILDMGGVIVELDKALCIRNFKQIAGMDDIETYLDIFHQKGFISDLEEGLTTEEEFYEEALRHCRPGATAADIEFCFQSLLTGLKPEMVANIRRLSLTCPLYVLSNNNPICVRRFNDLLAAEGIADCFKEFFYSYRLRLLKPGPEIFHEVISRIGFEPEEILFVDDAPRNIAGAQAVGLQAVLFHDGIEL